MCLNIRKLQLIQIETKMLGSLLIQLEELFCLHVVKMMWFVLTSDSHLVQVIFSYKSVARWLQLKKQYKDKHPETENN